MDELLNQQVPNSLEAEQSVLGAMLIGRVAWGITMYLLLHGAFSWQAFAAGAFVNALPGIALHLLLIPPIVLALQKAGKI